jgi:toxin FitB
MIVLDTNVLSEALLPSPDGAVMRGSPPRTRSESSRPRSPRPKSFTAFRYCRPASAVPDYKRQSRTYSPQSSRAKIWPFDEEAARVFPKIVSHGQAIGRPVSHFDGLIASICRARGAAVATRNTADFEHSGISIINPWRE